MKLSIVTTLYQSASYIREFYERSTEVAKKLVEDSYEIIFVNDGSPDNSLDLAVQLTEHDPHVIVVNLSRNFGHHKALMTGLSHATGERIFLIDSDLEEVPECLLSFAEKMERASCDVVYGVQEHRKGNWFERWSGNLFWVLINGLSGLKIPSNVTTARLMTRQYVNALLKHDEREIFMAGLWYITGFNQQPLKIVKGATSPSTYTLRRKLSLFVNSVTSFSNAPLIGIFYIGLLITAFSSCYIFYLFFNRLFLSIPLSGWTSLMASIWLIGGLLILFLGIIGIYLAKVFSETKRRPYVIIKDIYGAH